MLALWLKVVSIGCCVLWYLIYASTVWDPHTQANINKVESIQRRAARFVTYNYDPRASVTTLLQDLNWPPYVVYVIVP
jgi:hypothetical protein